MGTSIELTVGGISLSYSKNHMGLDWGHLFQEGDLTRRQTKAINYDYYAEHPELADELVEAEQTFVRPLSKVLPRLALLGHTLDGARAEGLSSWFVSPF
jgi:HEPN/Toprim N-terminal domain 1